jgi:hypothetical protein
MAHFTPMWDDTGLTSEEVAFIQNLVELGYQEGDLIYFDGAALNRLPIGDDGEVLTSHGAGTTPTWEPAGVGTVETPTGDVDGINVTYTTVNTPKFLIIDNSIYVSGKGYTYSSPTITVDSLIAPTDFIRNVY